MAYIGRKSLHHPKSGRAAARRPNRLSRQWSQIYNYESEDVVWLAVAGAVVARVEMKSGGTAADRTVVRFVASSSATAIVDTACRWQPQP